MSEPDDLPSGPGPTPIPENTPDLQANPYATPEANLVPTGEPPTLNQWELASRWARLGGAIIDGLIMIPIALITFFALGVGTQIFSGEGVGIGIQLLVSLLSLAAFIAINYHFWEKNGQSIGKLALGTRIVRTNGHRCPANRIITHRILPIYIIQQVPVIGSIVGLVDALLIFRASKKCLHDDIADTIVIKA